MNSEVLQRAMALSSLVEGASTDPFRTADPDTPREELDWSASVLLARIISASRYLVPRVTEGEFELAIGRPRLDEFRAKGWVRIVAGELCVASPFHLDRTVRVEKSEEADLAKLRALLFDRSRRDLWISGAALKRCVGTHRRTFEATPSSELLNASFEPHRNGRTGGYFLKLEVGARSGWTNAIVPRAVARFWELLSTKHARSQQAARFDEWFAHLRCARDAIVTAVGFISASDRATIVYTARERILSDADLGNFEQELATRGEAVLDSRTTRFVPPDPPSLASIYAYWDDRGDGYDDTRETLHYLILIVLEHDSWRQGQFDMTLRLIEAGEEKPYLVEAAAIYLRETCRSRIPWLLSRPRSLALGLALIAELRLTEPTMMDETEARDARVHQRRVLLFGEAMATAVATLLDDAHPNTGAIVDTLRALARRCVLPPNPQARRAANVAREEELFALAVAHFTQARRRGYIVAGQPDAEALILGEDFRGLMDRMRERFPKHEGPEKLKVGFELLRFLREHPHAFLALRAGGREELEAELGEMLLTTYHEVLAIEADDASSFRFFFYSVAVLTLPWALLAVSLSAQADEAFLSWVRAQALSDKLAVAANMPDGDARDDVIAGVAVRWRGHLAVLLNAHSGSASVTSATRDERGKVRRHLEAEIERLVLAETDLAAGTVALFDRAIVSTLDDAERAALVKQTVAVIETFDYGTRERIFKAWAKQTNDATTLIAIGEIASSKDVLEAVEQTVSSGSIIAAATDDYSLDFLLRTTFSAAVSNHVGLTQGLLAQGDKIPSRHPWRAQWDETAFRSRLLLAFHSKDRKTIETVPLPESATQPEKTKALGEVRKFYEALLDLDEDAERGRNAFRTLLAREPTSAALVTNLFAAELRVAKGIAEESQRRSAFESALRDWHRRAAHFPMGSMEPHASLNVLVALDGAALDDEFDVTWNAMSEVQRGRLDVAQVRLENLRRRKLDTDADRLAESIRARFDGELPESFGLPASVAAKAVEAPDEPDHARNMALIRNLPASQLAKVVGQTGTESIADYLAEVHVRAALTFVRHKQSIETFKDEDAVNDVVSSFVGMQISPFNWNVSDQSRVGARRRDWVTASSMREVAISEALRLRSVDHGAIQDHVSRLVGRYNPQGADATFLVAYFEGPAFAPFCERYEKELSRLDFQGWTRRAVENKAEDGNAVRRYRVHLERDGLKATQDHILIHMSHGNSGAGEVRTDEKTSAAGVASAPSDPSRARGSKAAKRNSRR